MKSFWLSCFLGLAALVYYAPESSIERPAGVLVPEGPRQDPPGAVDTWIFKGYRMQPLAGFTVRARVLMKEQYWFGRETEISPLDLTLGWGLMSDQTVARQFQIYRGHRRFWWKPETDFARSQIGEVIRHSANVHIVPATSALAHDLTTLRRGHIVTLGGMLVQANGADGWVWRSSLRRDDTGDGACELMWVEWLRVE